MNRKASGIEAESWLTETMGYSIPTEGLLNSPKSVSMIDGTILK